MALRRNPVPDGGVLAGAPSSALVLGAIVSVQIGAAAAVKLFPTVGPGGATLLRLVFASALLVSAWRPRMRGRSSREWLLAAAFGFVLAAMNFSIYNAMHRIPLGVAVALEFVGPLGVAVAGSRRPIDVLWVALAAGGILALTRGGSHGLDAVGVIFAITAGGLWAAYILLSARVGQIFERGTGLALAMLCATAFALPVGIHAGGSALLKPHALLLGAVAGLMSSAIPYSFELEALRRIEPHVFGVLMSLEPAVAALVGLVLLGQHLSARSLLGIGLVVIASIGAVRPSGAPPLDG